MSIKKSYRRIESYYYFCDYCNKKMGMARGPEEPSTKESDFKIDSEHIYTNDNSIHVSCLKRMLKVEVI